EAGGTVCLKSDSNELMRHMYQEAAKLVKYGGMSETDVLKAITLNGAKQLGLEQRVGSIEVGKDADLAVFNGHPLNSYSRVEMTLVDGEVYFQRSEKLTPDAHAAAAPTTQHETFREISPNTSGTYVLSGVTLHPVSGPERAGVTVIIEKDRIKQILPGEVREPAKVRDDGGEGGTLRVVAPDGKGVDVAVPSGLTTVSATGLHLYPGMI